MNILIADSFARSGIDELRESGCDVACDPDLQDDALRDAIVERRSEVLIVRSTKVTEAMLEAGKDLKLVIRAGAGYDTIDVGAATARGIRVCNCPGTNSVAVAELTLGLMICLDRRIVDETDDLRHGVWNKREYSKARGLKGRTLGIVGLGRIGYEVAKRAKAFEMDLVYSDECHVRDVENELGICKVSFEDLLEQADFVTLHVPGGEQTRHMIGSDELRRMKPTAFLLNCCRGGVVDEKALSAALAEERIAGAALDVYEIEPAATDTEFTDPIPHAPHVYGTHHVGASTEQAQSAVAEMAVAIVHAFMTEGRFPHCVNPQQTAGA